MVTRSVILEPLSTGDIIDRSVRIYRNNLRPLLGTVALPFVVGVVGGLMMQFGRNSFSLDDPDASAPIRGAVLMGGGLLVWLLYAYLMLLTVAGLSRTVGDHIMLGEPITVRASVRAIRTRLGTLSLASLIFALAAVVTVVLTSGVFFVSAMIGSVVGLLLTSAGFPPGVAGLVVVFTMLVALVAAVFVVAPLVIARVVFIPQAVMIEGSSASTALSRSLSLGAKNWYRVLSILFFTYFVSYSLAAAVLVPVGLLLWLTGYLSLDQETFDAASTGIVQFASFLVVPVWSIAYTLLYFDNRVRKEGYDVDLLARRLPPPPPPLRTPAPAPGSVPAAVAGGFVRRKFAADGRCLRCGRYNVFDSMNCPGCGW